MRKTENVSIPVNERITVNAPDLKNLLGVGLTTARKIGEESGAVVRIGRRTVYRLDKIREYMESQGV